MLQRLALRYVCMEYTICWNRVYSSYPVCTYTVFMCVLLLRYVSVQSRLQYISSRAC